MTRGSFQKSGLAGRAIAATVILRSVKSIHPGLCVLHEDGIFLVLKWTCVTTQYIYIYIFFFIFFIFFSEQSKEGCHVANGKPLRGASPGEDWPYYWRSSTGWACYCMFKQSVSKKSFPCTDSDFIVKQIRSAENKAQVKWFKAKCYQ